MLASGCSFNVHSGLTGELWRKPRASAMSHRFGDEDGLTAPETVASLLPGPKRNARSACGTPSDPPV
jgi:hypothetical protein